MANKVVKTAKELWDNIAGTVKQIPETTARRVREAGTSARRAIAPPSAKILIPTFSAIQYKKEALEHAESTSERPMPPIAEWRRQKIAEAIAAGRAD